VKHLLSEAVVNMPLTQWGGIVQSMIGFDVILCSY